MVHKVGFKKGSKYRLGVIHNGLAMAREELQQPQKHAAIRSTAVKVVHFLYRRKQSRHLMCVWATSVSICVVQSTLLGLSDVVW